MIKDEEIRIRSSTCPEQICVNTSYISKPGPAIICLPHMVIINIEAVGGQNDDLIIST
ncbi:NusG domain II-containing protein [Bacillus sp. V3B]|uniref:NusG domain II-containing protein n=1 Tax=Bacillus sp. V3B TaxID=2804915 RepID=UPI00210A6520|nr:NusG domain II-containing protein [Bacillus sp. V3B]